MFYALTFPAQFMEIKLTIVRGNNSHDDACDCYGSWLSCYIGFSPVFIIVLRYSSDILQHQTKAQCGIDDLRR